MPNATQQTKNNQVKKQQSNSKFNLQKTNQNKSFKIQIPERIIKTDPRFAKYRSELAQYNKDLAEYTKQKEEYEERMKKANKNFIDIKRYSNGKRRKKTRETYDKNGLISSRTITYYDKKGDKTKKKEYDYKFGQLIKRKTKDYTSKKQNSQDYDAKNNKKTLYITKYETNKIPKGAYKIQKSDGSEVYRVSGRNALGTYVNEYKVIEPKRETKLFYYNPVTSPTLHATITNFSDYKKPEIGKDLQKNIRDTIMTNQLVHNYNVTVPKDVNQTQFVDKYQTKFKEASKLTFQDVKNAGVYVKDVSKQIGSRLLQIPVGAGKLLYAPNYSGKGPNIADQVITKVSKGKYENPIHKTFSVDGPMYKDPDVQMFGTVATLGWASRFKAVKTMITHGLIPATAGYTGYHAVKEKGDPKAVGDFMLSISPYGMKYIKTPRTRQVYYEEWMKRIPEQHRGEAQNYQYALEYMLSNKIQPKDINFNRIASLQNKKDMIPHLENYLINNKKITLGGTGAMETSGVQLKRMPSDLDFYVKGGTEKETLQSMKSLFTKQNYVTKIKGKALYDTQGNKILEVHSNKDYLYNNVKSVQSVFQQLVGSATTTTPKGVTIAKPELLIGRKLHGGFEVDHGRAMGRYSKDIPAFIQSLASQNQKNTIKDPIIQNVLKSTKDLQGAMTKAPIGNRFANLEQASMFGSKKGMAYGLPSYQKGANIGYSPKVAFPNLMSAGYNSQTPPTNSYAMFSNPSGYFIPYQAKEGQYSRPTGYVTRPYGGSTYTPATTTQYSTTTYQPPVTTTNEVLPPPVMPVLNVKPQKTNRSTQKNKSKAMGYIPLLFSDTGQVVKSPYAFATYNEAVRTGMYMTDVSPLNKFSVGTEEVNPADIRKGVRYGNFKKFIKKGDMFIEKRYNRFDTKTEKRRGSFNWMPMIYGKYAQ